MPIDPNEAPPGFYAVPPVSLGCKDCEYVGNKCHILCFSSYRRDETRAVFKRIPQTEEWQPMMKEIEVEE